MFRLHHEPKDATLLLPQAATRSITQPILLLVVCMVRGEASTLVQTYKLKYDKHDVIDTSGPRHDDDYRL
jgi:hypothetical protein